MNERIRELAEQAWDATAVSPDFGHPVSFAEKFAELIVEECIYLAKEVPLEGPAHTFTGEYENGFWDAIDLYKELIENHFASKNP